VVAVIACFFYSLGRKNPEYRTFQIEDSIITGPIQENNLYKCSNNLIQDLPETIRLQNEGWKPISYATVFKFNNGNLRVFWDETGTTKLDFLKVDYQSYWTIYSDVIYKFRFQERDLQITTCSQVFWYRWTDLNVQIPESPTPKKPEIFPKLDL
jgi:hypothetical protein